MKEAPRSAPCTQAELTHRKVQVNLAVTHPWDLTTDQAKEIQTQLATKVIAETTFEPDQIKSVAGIDVSIRENRAQAAAVVLSFPDLEPIDHSLSQAPVSFPYVPGLLAFREGPCVLEALAKLRHWPDLMVFDGQGVAHPRRIGLAAHMGVILDQPSIGCAKSRLIGSHEEPGSEVGERAPLHDGGQVIGAVVRTRAGVKPVFVSIGHRIDLETAVGFVLRCTRGYRLPETTRYAHRVAGGASL
jgi:deoxyribonuclease V